MFIKKNSKPSNNQLKEDLAYIKHQLNKTEKNWKRSAQTRVTRISEQFSIPPEIFNSEMIISLINNSKLIIENYGKVIDYSEESIRISNKSLSLTICGSCLKITCYTEQEIIIKGCIKSVSFGG